MKTLYPDNLIVSDLKIVDAGGELAGMGFEVSVTGELTLDMIKLFKGIPVKCFIVGRNLRNAADPASEAMAYKAEIAKYWS